jgi:hypothetical protein
VNRWNCLTFAFLGVEKGATLPEPRAPRALTAGNDTLHQRAGPTTTETARRVHARDYYGAATEEPWRAIMSVPHDAHYARYCVT